MSIRIYYAGMLYDEVPYEPTLNNFPRLYDYPDGIYLKFSPNLNKYWPSLWYLKDKTPVLPQDIPKELLVLELLNPPNST